METSEERRDSSGKTIRSNKRGGQTILSRLSLALSEAGHRRRMRGGTWHSNTEKAVEDNERQNYLEANGWHVLRYSTKQLQNPMECLNQIKNAINKLDGLVRAEQTDWFETQNSNGTMQLELFKK